VDSETVQNLWRAAVAAAGIDPEKALLFEFRGDPSPSACRAKTWAPGSTIDNPDDRAALGERLDEANSEGGRAGCRIGVWIDRSPESLAGVLRHELEHCLQFEAHGHVLQTLHDRAVEILSEQAGGLDGSGSLYNKIPMEVDATSAAAIFVRSIFGNLRIDSFLRARHEDAALFRLPEGSQPVDSLLCRMKRFILIDGPRLANDFATRTSKGVA